MNPNTDTRTDIQRAASLLRDGGLVAFPTETVYGLGADATDLTAVARIFEAKERPSFDPLIVHLADSDWLLRYVESIPPDAQRLADHFWPGPLTLVLPKRPIIPDIVTAGLPTVAVRVPAHPIAHALLEAADIPIAAPSANRFGRISPTTADAVRIELGDRVDFVLDGGPTQHGIESTVVAFDDGVRILRPGPITREKLQHFLGHEIAVVGREKSADGNALESPGQLARHYSPRTPMRLVTSVAEFSPSNGQRVGLLAFQQPTEGFDLIEVLSDDGDLREAAANLFAALRRLDEAELDLIVAESVPEHGLGVAIMDRLRKASSSSF